jgi:starvation-inducible outer membrane lipoprotein
MEVLWEKLQFWKKSRMEQKVFEENIDYQFIEIQDTDVNAIKLLRGPYKDVVYCYGKAAVKEQGEIAKLEFDYIVIDPGIYLLEDLTRDEEFHTMIGDILVEMITVEGKNEQIRNNNSQEFDLQ